jgi:hypothetical protein
MKMSKPGLCCDECFDLLAKRSPRAARLWLDLCEIQNTCALFGLKIHDNELLQLLEILSFITTTDTKEVIVVKVHGKVEDTLGSFFCGGNCGR